MVKEDITGQKFNMLTVIECVGVDKHHNSLYRCLCDCGKEVTLARSLLTCNKQKSCGCIKRGFKKGKKPNDIIGSTIGYVKVIQEAGSENGSKLYEVECVCGNTFVTSRKNLYRQTINCGCMKNSLVSKSHSKDLSGMIFGKLTAISQEKLDDGKLGWLCNCSCGNKTTVLTSRLIAGRTKSCGCLQKEKTRVDITGQIFGLLTVIDIAYSDKEYVYWNCVCKCGNCCVVSGASLRSGNTISCGCSKSKGEQVVELFLKQNDIKYQKQKRFVGCKDKNPLLFDFYLSDRNIAIEYDGDMHYKATRRYNDLEGQQRRDAIKTKYCEENDIILLRIPYWEKDNIESILSDWLFLNEDERNDDDENLCKTAG